ncbi:MAG TPA: hypothetical protein VNA86_06210, partial [bacterium]|nr:hypothetical protein [bacterium]
MTVLDIERLPPPVLSLVCAAGKFLLRGRGANACTPAACGDKPCAGAPAALTRGRASYFGRVAAMTPVGVAMQCLRSL